MNHVASSYADLGRHADALKLYEETLTVQKAKLGPDHPDTLASMGGVATCLVHLDRSAEALPVIDDCVRRATGKIDDPRLLSTVMDLRLRYFEKAKDAAGCRQTAEMWEKLGCAGTDNLYIAARMRTVTATVLRATDKSSAGCKQADAEADRAMTWLKQAVAAGYKNTAQLRQDRNLDALRERADFTELLKTFQTPSPKN
jgi:hypothetical protein